MLNNCKCGLLLILIGLLGGWWIGKINFQSWELLSPKGIYEEVKPYANFSLLKLVSSEYSQGKIEVEADKFYYTSQGKKVSGAINFPSRKGSLYYRNWD